jgi:hypothetical protein
MKRFLLLLAGLAWAATLMAQSGGAGPSAPAAAQKPAVTTPATGSSSNPFPEDTSTIPVMPTATTPIPAADSDSRSYAASSAVSVAGDDADPVRSPDDPEPEVAAGAEGDSSSSKALDKILGPAGDESADKQDRKHRHEHETPQKQPTKKEAASEDITVGSYYLDKKNWKAAQSRYQSAMVLDPENPEVYWGLAESAYHLGDLATARDNYLKVADYDPDGPHGKQLKKILSDPALLNAKPLPLAAPPPPDQPKQ